MNRQVAGLQVVLQFASRLVIGTLHSLNSMMKLEDNMPIIIGRKFIKLVLTTGLEMDTVPLLNMGSANGVKAILPWYTK